MALGASGVDVAAVVWNRRDSPGAPLSGVEAAVQLSAPETVPAPVGIEAMRRGARLASQDPDDGIEL